MYAIQNFISTIFNNCTLVVGRNALFVKIFVSVIAFVILWELSYFIANRLSPKKSARARIIRKYVDEMTTTNSDGSTFTNYDYYIVFATESNAELKMLVKRRDYLDAREGDLGVLYRRGKKFLGFHSLSLPGEQNFH